jgi:hypothetical protein
MEPVEVEVEEDKVSVSFSLSIVEIRNVLHNLPLDIVPIYFRDKDLYLEQRAR